MFTGIIEELGEITAVERVADAARITVRGPLAVSDASHGDSISVSGVCESCPDGQLRYNNTCVTTCPPELDTTIIDNGVCTYMLL